MTQVVHVCEVRVHCVRTPDRRQVCQHAPLLSGTTHNTTRRPTKEDRNDEALPYVGSVRSHDGGGRQQVDQLQATVESTGHQVVVAQPRHPVVPIRSDATHTPAEVSAVCSWVGQQGAWRGRDAYHAASSALGTSCLVTRTSLVLDVDSSNRKSLTASVSEQAIIFPSGDSAQLMTFSPICTPATRTADDTRNKEKKRGTQSRCWVSGRSWMSVRECAGRRDLELQPGNELISPLGSSSPGSPGCSLARMASLPVTSWPAFHTSNTEGLPLYRNRPREALNDTMGRGGSGAYISKPGCLSACTSDDSGSACRLPSTPPGGASVLVRCVCRVECRVSCRVVPCRA